VNTLPKTWSFATFGELNCFESKSIAPQRTPSEIFELYSVPAFPNGQPERVSGAEIGSTKQVVRPKDVLVCKINPRINRVWEVGPYTGTRQIASSEWIGFRAPQFDPRYLRYFFTSASFREDICADVTGVGGSLTRAQPKRVSQIEIPLAPLQEQNRIADKLDVVLARVDACRNRLDLVPAILGRFRQAVLEAATSGALTDNWRSSRAGSLWRRHTLGELIADGPKNGLYKPASSYGEGTRILRIDSFSDGYVTSFDSLKRLSVTESEIEQFGLRNGDVVINRVNSIEHLGKCALIEGLEGPCVFESNMMRIRTVADLLPKYLRIALCSPRGRSGLISHAKHAVNQASINQGDVRAVEIHLPSLDEQREIVRRVDSLFALADSLIVRHATVSTALSRLTPALLAKAFRGELVPQDPSDEPAAVLLNRLKTQSSGEGNATKGGHAQRAGKSRERTVNANGRF
jgi:type I restriction enzyme, S subunit